MQLNVRLIATISQISVKKGLIEKKHYESAHIQKSKKSRKNAINIKKVLQLNVPLITM